MMDDPHYNYPCTLFKNIMCSEWIPFSFNKIKWFSDTKISSPGVYNGKLKAKSVVYSSSCDRDSSRYCFTKLSFRHCFYSIFSGEIFRIAVDCISRPFGTSSSPYYKQRNLVLGPRTDGRVFLIKASRVKLFSYWWNDVLVQIKRFKTIQSHSELLCFVSASVNMPLQSSLREFRKFRSENIVVGFKCFADIL